MRKNKGKDVSTFNSVRVNPIVVAATHGATIELINVAEVDLAIAVCLVLELTYVRYGYPHDRTGCLHLQ